MAAAGDDDLDLLAGEYALGTLDRGERQAVERRMLDNPDLARRVAAWEGRLAPLSEGLPPVAPSPVVWGRLRRTVAAREAATRGEAPRRAAAARWWDRLTLWRGWAAAATAAAAVLLALVLRPGEPPRLVAVLSDPEGRPLWVVRAGEGEGRLLARPVDGAGAAGQVPQLWLAQPAGPPVSLGLLERGGGGGDRQVLTPPPTVRLLAGDTMAISLEPPGGSPTGRPTGPVVSHGVLLPEPL